MNLSVRGLAVLLAASGTTTAFPFGNYLNKLSEPPPQPQPTVSQAGAADASGNPIFPPYSNSNNSNRNKNDQVQSLQQQQQQQQQQQAATTSAFGQSYIVPQTETTQSSPAVQVSSVAQVVEEVAEVATAAAAVGGNSNSNSYSMGLSSNRPVKKERPLDPYEEALKKYQQSITPPPPPTPEEQKPVVVSSSTWAGAVPAKSPDNSGPPPFPITKPATAANAAAVVVEDPVVIQQPEIVENNNNIAQAAPVEVPDTSSGDTAPTIDQSPPPPPVMSSYGYSLEGKMIKQKKKTVVPPEHLQNIAKYADDNDKAVDIQKARTNDKKAAGPKPFFAAFVPNAPKRPPPKPKDLTKPRLQRIMERISKEGQTGGAGGASTYEAFQRAEENWSQLKASKPFTYDSSLVVPTSDDKTQQFVSDDISKGSPKAWAKLRAGKELDYDAVVCGGTLGIFFATALAVQGHRTCVVESGELKGREQEWNISKEELDELIKAKVVTKEDIDAAVMTEFPGCRSGFKNREVTPLWGGLLENKIGYECVTPDVLNLGVSPVILLGRVKQRFLDLGGVIKEQTPLKGIVVSDKLGSGLDLGDDNEPITSRLVLDCMGNSSPISKQQRYGKKPDGVCAVVGSCAGGYDPETNLVGDIIYTNSEIKDLGKHGQLQYFWEAFPVGIGRNGNEPGTSDVKTTYMFTYFDADENRPSLEMLMDDYFDTLPNYQESIHNAEDDLDFKRVLFAYFPTYKDSPLKPQWSRVLAVGDASGIQSPLSFGGFGSLTRHLARITGAITEALDADILEKDDLAEINAYQPNLSAAWMFQKAMSVRMGQQVDTKFVNRLLATNFEVMHEQGQQVMKPFMQDVLRFDGLTSSLSGTFAKDPAFVPDIVKHVGIQSLAEWLVHVAMMGLYAILHAVVTPILTPFIKTFKSVRQQFQWKRRMESWKFGSGSDYKHDETVAEVSPEASTETSP